LVPRADAPPNAGVAEAEPKADPPPGAVLEAKGELPERGGAASAGGGDVAAGGETDEVDVDVDGATMPGYFVPLLIDSE
jgi:hypothetical protein